MWCKYEADILVLSIKDSVFSWRMQMETLVRADKTEKAKSLQEEH